MTANISPSDHAKAEFDKLVLDLINASERDLTESDTRSKLIDPIFKTVLGWSETDIRREQPAADGYADYVFGADYAYFHVEAKRALPRFKLQVPSRSRVLKLSGPHLLGHKDVKPHVEQAAKYASDLGSNFCLLTNGSQFILFRNHISGQSWKTGNAIVWHDYNDISADFASFYTTLSRTSVTQGSLMEKLSSVSEFRRPVYTPIDHVWNPDREFVRNKLWNSISRVFGPLLSVRPDDDVLQSEIVKHCYVTTPLSDEADRNIDTLLQDRMPSYLSNSLVEDLPLGHHGDRRFSDRLLEDIHSFQPRTFVLTGGVGSGKTTFLRRFSETVSPEFVRKFCVWLHIDYLPTGNITGTDIGAQLRSYTMRQVKSAIYAHHPKFAPASGADLRQLFHAEIEQLSQTKLFQVPPESEQWKTEVNALISSKATNDVTLTESILHTIAAKGRRLVFVLDNSDQLGEQFQAELFLFAQHLAKEFNALTLVAIREEKYFAAFRRGIFDAYGDRRFHIGSPSLNDVIRKRLLYGIQKLNQMYIEKGVSLSERQDIEQLVETVIRSTTQRNSNIVRMLSCVSNGDMRHALDLFREFISSGNTDISKILKKGRGYTIPFHEFAKSAILGSRRYFRSDVSHFMNVFRPTSAARASHFTACRVLRRLSDGRTAQSIHGEGFIATSQFLREWRSCFGVAEDVILAMQELMKRGLVETEPPRVSRVEETDAVSVSASGEYYWQYLVRSFAYVDLMIPDTPLFSEDVSRDLVKYLDDTALSKRFERVEMFLSYLAQCESEEGVIGAMGSDGPFSGNIVDELRSQIQNEIAVIKRRMGSELD